MVDDPMINEAFDEELSVTDYKRMLDNCQEHVNVLEDRIKELEAQKGWKDIKDLKSDKVVFIYYKNDLGKGRTVKALYAKKFEKVDEFSEYDCSDYDEETDEFYWPEGWYEDVEADTGNDYGFHHLGDIKPTHFMEIPTPPTKEGGKA